MKIVKLGFNTSKFMTPDSELEKIKASYAIHMTEEAQRELKKAAPQIERFTAIAASKGVALDDRSFEYIQTIGVIAKAPGLAKTLLGPIQAERDELLSFSEIAKKYNQARGKPVVLSEQTTCSWRILSTGER